jgi:hypothetical protein
LASRGWVRTGLAAYVLLFGTGARVYLTEEDALRIAFPEATRLSERVFEIGDGKREELAEQLGYKPRERGVIFYEASKDGTVIGHALVMDEIGKHLPLTFLVSIQPGGKVDQVMLLAFREPRGDEVKSPIFLRQYRGKTVVDPIRRNRDIRNISGATMSVDAMNRGLRRALVFYDRLIRPPATPPVLATPNAE